MKAVFGPGAGTSKSPFERYLRDHPMGDIISRRGRSAPSVHHPIRTVELLKEIGGETRSSSRPWRKATSSGR